jgi:hypothetical protein
MSTRKRLQKVPQTGATNGTVLIFRYPAACCGVVHWLCQFSHHVIREIFHPLRLGLSRAPSLLLRSLFNIFSTTQAVVSNLDKFWHCDRKSVSTPLRAFLQSVIYLNLFRLCEIHNNGTNLALYISKPKRSGPLNCRGKQQ